MPDAKVAEEALSDRLPRAFGCDADDTGGVIRGEPGDARSSSRQPRLLALAGEDAPSRVILCAGAGHFACADITLSRGHHIGDAPDAGHQVIACWKEISDRSEAMVPAYGFVQVERELADAGLTVPKVP